MSELNETNLTDEVNEAEVDETEAEVENVTAAGEFSAESVTGGKGPG